MEASAEGLMLPPWAAYPGKRLTSMWFKQGSGEPWTHMLEYHQERETVPNAGLDDGSLVYS